VNRVAPQGASSAAPVRDEASTLGLASASAPIASAPPAPLSAAPSASSAIGALGAPGALGAIAQAPADAGAPGDCAPGARPRGVVELPPLDQGMMNNATVDASFDRGHLEVVSAVRRSADRLACCYDEALRAHDGLAGRLVVGFSLDPVGKPMAASIDTARSTIADPALHACVLGVWRDLSFAPSKRGRAAAVSLPIVFRPGTDAAPSPKATLR
jgi:hypothetical protein